MALGAQPTDRELTEKTRALRDVSAPYWDMSPEQISPDVLLQAPKVLLHDHLDGGLRPLTVIELADETGYDGLPTTDPDELAAWMTRGADRKDLVLYLDTFAHTTGVMQTADALHRVARECAEDLIADGVVYAESRFAPELHTEQGLSMDEVLEAVTSGFADASAGTPLTIRTICSAMRHQQNSYEVAQLAVKWRDRGVIGFDIAGPENGFPPDDHMEAFQYAQRENFHFTIHAGEAYGPPSIWKALQWCGAERLGHGVRIVDDISVDDDGQATLGHLAHSIRDRRVPLEVCPTSNLHTGVVDDLADHPIKLFKELKFRVTLNTDNRLMSNISMTGEMENMVRVFGWDLADMQWLTVNGMKSAFLPFDERLALINDVIKPRYRELIASSKGL